MHLPSIIFSTENGLLRHSSIESWEKSVNKMSLYRCITLAFTQWKIPGWFPVWGGHKYSCQEYSGTDFCVNINFSSKNIQECALLSCKVSIQAYANLDLDCFPEWLDHSSTSNVWVIQFLCIFARIWYCQYF